MISKAINCAEHEYMNIGPPNYRSSGAPGTCKFGKYMFPSQFANIFLTYLTFVTNLYFLTVELPCIQVAKKIAPCDRPLNCIRMVACFFNVFNLH